MNAKKPAWDEQRRAGGMSPLQTTVLVLLVAALSVGLVGVMAKAMDSAHGGVVEPARP